LTTSYIKRDKRCDRRNPSNVLVEKIAKSDHEMVCLTQFINFGKRQRGLSKKEVGSISKMCSTLCVALAIIHVYISVSMLIISEPLVSGRNLLSTMLQDTSLEYETNLRFPTNQGIQGATIHEMQRPFPRWGKTALNEEKYGMDLGPVLDFIVNSSSYTYISQQKSNKDTRYIPTTDHIDDVGAWLPETLYVIDANGLWSSLRHRMCNSYGIGNIKTKVIPTEHAIQSALEFLQHDTTTTCKQWPRLCDTLLVKDGVDNATTGFPFLIYFGDFTGCNYHNYKGKFSVPLFTAAANVNCYHTFPFPTHELLGMTRNDQSEWDDFFAESQKNFPWEKKLLQVVWRGALTGPYVNDTYKNPRWNLVRTIQTIKNDFVKLGFKKETFIFNVGAVRLPVRRKNKTWKDDLHEVGGLVDRIDRMERFQMYRAILDIDGNSWSSRFNILLCYNSVVIKVEPTWVDYLQFKGSHGEVLQPWKHYIPVKADLSDLFEKAAFVMDPINDDILKKIIYEANVWCRQRLIKRSIDIDVLDTFERYIEYIDIGNPGWKKGMWSKAKKNIFSSNSTLAMKLLSWDEDIYFGKAEADAYRIQHGLPLHTIKIET
jgi:Glycosyl transferase family 90